MHEHTSIRTKAREEAALTLVQAAKKARISTAYLRQIEAGRTVSYPLAQRLAFLYGIPIDVFLPITQKGGR